MTAGIGTQSETIADTRTYTIDPLLSTKIPILNYDDPRYAIAEFDPILSPDGSRLGLRAKQLHAVRRNMNLPPVFTQIGSESVHDTTAVVNLNVVQGQSLVAVVTATDSDDGARTCDADFLTQPGMAFDPSTRIFVWVDAGPVGTYYVKFSVTNGNSVGGGAQNGAMDAIIAKITVTSSAPARLDRPIALTRDGGSGDWVVKTEAIPRATATLRILDVAGRAVARITVPSGRELRWDLRTRSGTRVRPGIYLYHIVAGARHGSGKIVAYE